MGNGDVTASPSSSPGAAGMPANGKISPRFRMTPVLPAIPSPSADLAPDVIYVDGGAGDEVLQQDNESHTLGARTQVLTRTGTVIGTPIGNEFMLLTARGRTYRVRIGFAPPMKIREGDQLRVYGTWAGNLLSAANIRLLGTIKPGK
jgi:hypothetical protein